MAVTGVESDSSFRKTLRGVLILPFSPRAGFSAVNKNSRLPTAIAVAVVFAAVYAIAGSFTGPQHGSDSGEFQGATFAYGLVYSLLYFVVLLVMSATYMRGAVPTETRYSSNANVLAYWFGWRFLFSSFLVFFSPSLAISGENIVFLIVSVILSLWFLYLYVVALSVVNHAPLRRCWVFGFVALFVTSFFMSFAGAFLRVLLVG